MSRTLKYKGNFFNLIFCRSAISFDNFENSGRHTLN